MENIELSRKLFGRFLDAHQRIKNEIDIKRVVFIKKTHEYMDVYRGNRLGDIPFDSFANGIIDGMKKRFNIIDLKDR